MDLLATTPRSAATPLNTLYIPESQWRWIVTARAKGTQEPKGYLDLLPDFIHNLARAYLPDDQVIHRYRVVASEAFNANLADEESYGERDLKYFNKALLLLSGDMMRRQPICFRLGQAYMLRHLPHNGLAQAITTHDYPALNRELHYRQRAINTASETAETAFIAIASKRNAVAALLDPSKSDELAELNRLLTRLDAFENRIREGEYDVMRQAEEESHCLAGIATVLESLGADANGIGVLSTLAQQIELISKSFAQDATSYERCGRLLAAYECGDTTRLPPHLARTVRTSEESFLRAYRDYIVAERIFSARGQHKSAQFCMSGKKRVLNDLLARNTMTPSTAAFVNTYALKHDLPPHKETQQKAKLISSAESDELTALTTQADTQLRRDNIARAIKIYRNILKHNPNNLDTQHTLAQLYTSADDWEKAIGCYETLLAQHPNDTDISLELGRLYSKAGNAEQALVHLYQARRHQPNNPLILTEIGNTYLKLGMLAKAGHSFERAHQAH